MREVFYCFGCMGECKGRNHTPIGPQHTQSLHYHWQLPKPFRIRHLLLGFVTTGSFLEELVIGHWQQLCSPIPCHLLESPHYFPEIGESYRNEYPIWIDRMPVKCTTVEPHMPISFRFSHPILELGLIGVTNA